MAPNSSCCPNGFGFSRDGGSRCVGGTHKASDAPPLSARGRAAGLRESKTTPRACGVRRRGFDYTPTPLNRSNKGGAGQGSTGSGLLAGPDMCKHGYVYNRDGGYRCAGGSHYADSADGQALAAAQSQTRIVKRPPVVTECKHGYSFNRDGGSRCQGGSHVKDAADDVFAPKSQVVTTGACNHGYGYNREEGHRCKGGSHYVA